MRQPTENTAELESQAEDAASEDRAGDSLGEIIRTVIYALLIALVFRTAFFQPFSIPSGSMKSTLLIGDYLFVSKYSYGYSKYSLPFGSRIPESLMSGRIWSAEPERGDVIVFRNPTNRTEDYIKRLVGLPGDRIQVVDGLLYVNDEPVKLERIEPFQEALTGRVQRDLCNEAATESRDERRARTVCTKAQYVETLPNGVQHIVLDVEGVSTRGDNTREFVVPEGHYFFMGDNRDNSVDSRFELNLGMVPEEMLIGRAEFVLLSSEGAFWEIWKWRGDRFFKSIE